MGSAAAFTTCSNSNKVFCYKTNFPHTLEMDYCVKGSDVLNSQWGECLNRGREYVKMLCACPMYLCINKLCQQYYVQYCSGSFQPYFQNILCTVYISNKLNRRYGFSDSRSCRPRINTLMNLRVLFISLFSVYVIFPSVD